MNGDAPGKAGPVNVKAAFAVAAACLLGLGLIAWLNTPKGPATQCRARGGSYLVGPGGETACVDRNTFLPMIDNEASQGGR